MEDCCFCEMLDKEKYRVLYQNDGFFLTPSLGPLVEGHLLACSKEHLTAMGYLDISFGRELRTIREKVEEVFQEFYSSKVLLFEHGEIKSSCRTAGSCINHMHLHFLPLELSLREDLIEDGAKIKDLEGLTELNSFVDKNNPYLFINDLSGRYVATFNQETPTQYLRALVGRKIGLKEWNWRLYPRWKIFGETLLKLQGKFD